MNSWSPASRITVFLVVLLSQSLPPSGANGVQGHEEKKNAHVLPLSTKTIADPQHGALPSASLVAKIRWRGQDYEGDAAIEVLMSTIRNPAATHGDREDALDRLGTLGRQLIGKPCPDQLIALYDNLSNGEARAGVVLCLRRAEDPRGCHCVRGSSTRQKTVS